jgi:hypothetical protein
VALCEKLSAYASTRLLYAQKIEPHSAGGIPMNAPNDNTAANGLRGWWLSPPRPGMHRLISPWEYRHLRVSGVTRVAAGGFQLGIGLVLLSLGRSAGADQERRKMYRLSAWFLVPAALNLAGGSWYITIASSIRQ